MQSRCAGSDIYIQIFDYMNVQSIHNETFAKALPDGFLERVRALANFHEYGVFSSPQVDGIGNSTDNSYSSPSEILTRSRIVAGRTMLPNIISGFQSIANASNPLKFVYEAISYKPFISFFNVTQAAASNPLLGGIGASLTRTSCVYRRS